MEVVMAKNQFDGLVGSQDGVTVVQEGKGFAVGFEFGQKHYERIKAVPGAEFDKENQYWAVPLSSAEALTATVEDMRDFNRNNGVQVKDVPGGKAVYFDFEKTLNQEIGPVQGAEYKSDLGAWFVPSDSKAMTGKDGKTPFFDLAINKMRGLNIEIGKARENIMELAAASAKGRDLKPGIHFPERDHSYTGPIINANGHFAAQLSGIDDDKGVGFITIHKQADLGQAVLKGDDLRIDYDEQGKTKVRTTEVFHAQKAERESLTALAMARMDDAKVLNASTKDGQAYSGNVVEVGEHFVLQHAGRNSFALHDKTKLQMDVKPGEKLDVTYRNGQGKGPEKTRGHEAGVGR
jgi:hypothetical protein